MAPVNHSPARNKKTTTALYGSKKKVVHKRGLGADGNETKTNIICI